VEVTLKITPAAISSAGDRSLFVSASIPDPERWDGEFDALEITDAVVSLARVFLTAGWRLVTAAHPTIAPLLLYVAAELHAEGDRRVSIYQSELFGAILPTATRRFEAQGIGEIVWTEAVEGDRPVPGEWDRSLDVMRRQMLIETQPAAAVFVGGMQGIPDEYALFSELMSGCPRYAVGHPGGAARALALEQPPSTLRDQLVLGAVYPALWRAVLHGLEVVGA
jgi:SLOG cluster3 family